MKVLQHPISDKHKNALFFNGIIATGYKNKTKYCLEIIQDGETNNCDLIYIGENIFSIKENMVMLAKEINDDNLDENNEDCVDMLIDKFFAVTYNNRQVDEEMLVFDNYEEAIQEFEIFLNGL